MTPQLQKFRKLKIKSSIIKLSSNNLKRRRYLDSILTKELFIELFYICNYPANYISQKIFAPKGIKLCAGSIIDRAKKHSIKTPNISESNKNSITQTQKRNTCIKKYGAINCLSKNTSAYKKRNRTVKKKYGVKNVFQLDEIKKKSAETMISKYGVRHSIDLPNFERNNGRKSKAHLKIEKYLLSQNIEFESEVVGEFNQFNKKLQRFYSPSPDILLRSLKIIIEIYGDKWHGNLKIYKLNDLINTWNGTKTVKEIRKFDKIRQKQLESFGYKVIILWQRDIQLNFERVKQIINENCQNNKNYENTIAK